MKKYWCVFLLLPTLFFSCRSYPPNTPKSVRDVLKVAGDNRVELIKVLDHYQGESDSLKLRAAHFLIANMEYKYSEHYAFIEPFAEEYREIRKIYESQLKKKELMRKSGFLEVCKQCVDSLKKVYGDTPVREYDIHVITADYLIENIDLAFKMWEEPWSERFDFEQFCEYILPYRVRSEPLSNWRRELINRYHHIKDSVENLYDTEEMALYLNDLIGSQFIMESIDLPHTDALTADNIKIGECTDSYGVIVHAFRALGIPAMIDYTPQKDRSSKAHEWTVYLDTLSRFRPFDGGDFRRILYTKMPPSGSFPENTIIPLGEGFGPTVFRCTYALQEESLVWLERDSKRKIPPFFSSPYMKNITDTYEFPQYEGLEMDISSYNIPKDEIVYLLAFGFRGELREVDWSFIRENKVSFKAVGANLVYVLSTFKQEQFIPFSSPFALREDDKTIYQFLPELNNLREVCLTRKCNMSRNMLKFADNMPGSMFQGSNDPGFREIDTLFTIEEIPDYLVEQAVISDKSYRYIRFISPDSTINAAEIHFWGPDTAGNEQLLAGKIFHNIETLGKEVPENLFDGDIRTNFNAVAGSWVGLDLGDAARVTKVEYLPRNNYNVIEPGDPYELYYFNGGWISMGEMTGWNQYLHYKRVPANALLLLKNKTQGKEESVFTYENGKQVWW